MMALRRIIRTGAVSIPNIKLHWTIRSSNRYASIRAETEEIQSTSIAGATVEKNGIKVLFGNNKTADFKNIWLRDNCKCSKCIHDETGQKILDTPSLDINVRPNVIHVNNNGQLTVSWKENENQHTSTYDADWLYRYGEIFMQESFDTKKSEICPKPVLWDKSVIWKSLPQISYEEITRKGGLQKWLEMFFQYGIAMIRGVPPLHGELLNLVNQFTYVKQTQFGVTFDVIHEPAPGTHLAFSARHLDHHTDLNYVEKSPGMQMLHCLKLTDGKAVSSESGGKSFFVDGFRVAKWLEEHEPVAFHVLASTPVRFQIKNKGKRYSYPWPVICLGDDGSVSEIHYNNRTVGPLQAPNRMIVPFYHAYKKFSEQIRQESAQLEFHMQPGDVVAFNNRRLLHGRTAYDPSKLSRHLVGCYLDIDEVTSLYDSLVSSQ